MSCRTIVRPHVWVVCQCKREACRLVYCDVCGYDDRVIGPCEGEFVAPPDRPAPEGMTRFEELFREGVRE